MNQRNATFALAASAVLVIFISGYQIRSGYKGMVETLNPARAHFNQALTHVQELPASTEITEAAGTEQNAGVDVVITRLYGIGLYFYPSANFEKALDGKVLPDTNIDGYPVVAGVLADSPAAASGITAGTVITSINDQPVAGLSIAAISDLISAGGAAPVSIGILGDDEPIELTPVLLERKVSQP